eukprot:6180318-Pleurochrysis_carterae.AAC.3
MMLPKKQHDSCRGDVSMGQVVWPHGWNGHIEGRAATFRREREMLAHLQCSIHGEGEEGG